jgi:outer membrane protein OmpA-like peptidoglycan-associated protein
VPAGLNPDPNKPGCPLPDRDHDSVPDDRDACPDHPGAPSADPKKNGCPNQYVTVNATQITIKEEIYFDFNKATIKKRSHKLLESVAAVLRLTPAIKRVAIEGHADNRGTASRNRELTEQRAQSVMAFLISLGIAPERLQAKGYGADRPIADNATAKGRARNRRVDFFIVDPPQAAAPGKEPGAH